MSEEIDTWAMEYIICPYCGEKYHDSWEFLSGNTDCGEINCDNCHKKFKWSADFDVSYTTEKIETNDTKIS